MRKLLCLFLSILLLFGACAFPAPSPITEQQDRPTAISSPALAQNTPAFSAPDPSPSPEEKQEDLAQNGIYTSKEDVSRYIHEYSQLPSNFISKKEARKLGWEGGSLEPYAPGMCIGGDHFGNYEGILPEESSRKYWECDIDTLGAKSRGAKRIVYSDDGLIYYTEDHYESFTLLYDKEGRK